MINLEKGMKDYIRVELEKISNKMIERQVDEFREKLIFESKSIISKIVENILVTQNDSPHDLSTVIQIRMANLIIMK
jgi:hypothetical protein